MPKPTVIVRMKEDEMSLSMFVWMVMLFAIFFPEKNNNNQGNMMHEPLLGSEITPSIQPNVFSAFISMLPVILKEFAPIALADFGLDSGNTFNAYLLSHVPPEEDSSAAANIIYTTQLVIVIIPSAFLYVIMPTMSFRMPNYKKAVVTASVLFALLLSLPGSIASFFMGDIFFQLGAREAVCDIVDEYFSVFAFALPLWMVATALNKTAPAFDLLPLMYIECVLNFIFMMGFSGIFVKVYPLPHVSPIKTIALSYMFCSIARILLYSISYIYVDKFEHWNEINLKNYYEAFQHMFSMGWKLCAQLASELIAIYCLSVLTTLFLPNKTMNLAVLNVMGQYFEFSIILTLSMSIAAHNLTNKFCSVKEYDKVRPHVNTFLVMSVIYNLVFLTVLQAIPNLAVSFFMNPQDNTNTGLSGNFPAMFAIMSIGLIFNAFKDIINMTQRSLNLFALPMKISVAGVWAIGIPLAILFATCTNLGVGGILLGYNIGNILTGSFLLLHWQSVSQPKVVQEIFVEGSNKAGEFDRISSCFDMFFKPRSEPQSQESLRLVV